MYEFKSKPVQITSDEADLFVLCQDGSLWAQNCDDSYRQLACYKAPEKKEKTVSEFGYTREFEYMWQLWKSKVKNSSNKKLSAVAFSKLSKEEQTALCYSIDPYSRTNNEHQYLKRCETYINQKHWENIDVMEEMAKSVIPPFTDPIWSTEIFDQDSGITDKAKDLVQNLGMNKEKAWEMINDK